jgi:hypothetical protein
MSIFLWIWTEPFSKRAVRRLRIGRCVETWRVPGERPAVPSDARMGIPGRAGLTPPRLELRGHFHTGSPQLREPFFLALPPRPQPLTWLAQRE